jgi:hypothetical protein
MREGARLSRFGGTRLEDGGRKRRNVYLADAAFVLRGCSNLGIASEEGKECRKTNFQNVTFAVKKLYFCSIFCGEK